MSEPDSIATRQSLLARLKDVQDQESWRDFFETYWELNEVPKTGTCRCAGALSSNSN
jgi:hypothetical protein